MVLVVWSMSETISQKLVRSMFNPPFCGSHPLLICDDLPDSEDKFGG